MINAETLIEKIRQKIKGAKMPEGHDDLVKVLLEPESFERRLHLIANARLVLRASENLIDDESRDALTRAADKLLKRSDQGISMLLDIVEHEIRENNRS